MRKNDFVYRIFKDIPVHANHGTLTLQIGAKEDTIHTDQVLISWQCNLRDNEHLYQWYACNFKWEYKNYNMLPFLAKMQKAYIRWGSTPEEVIDFLHVNNIEHALHIKLYDQQTQIFSGCVTVAEILVGKFKRYQNQKEFTIPAGQQKRLIQQIQEEKSIDSVKCAVA